MTITLIPLRIKLEIMNTHPHWAQRLYGLNLIFFTRNFRITFHVKVFKTDLGFNNIYLINAIKIVKINYTGNDIIVSFVFENLPILSQRLIFFIPNVDR